jgi:hypothetical protein
MATTFLKRQKEMKRQEKQREKAERRKQKKLAKRAGSDDSLESTGSAKDDALGADLSGLPRTDPEN